MVFIFSDATSRYCCSLIIDIADAMLVVDYAAHYALCYHTSHAHMPLLS